ncbi:MAG: type VI secretion system tip protein TssI/VgrG [Polyangiaceae bacterium]
MADVTLAIDPSLEIDGTPYRVLHYRLREQLSTPSSLVLEAMEDDVEPKNPKELVCQTATFTLKRSDESQTRQLIGLVVRAERRADDDDVRTLHLSIAPVPWVLGKRRDSRVFQNMTVVDIAKEVLEKGGVSSAQQDWRLGADHPERPYLVQYRETDLEFLHRILSEEGIYYAVHHDTGQDVMVFGDDPTGFGAIEGKTTLPFFFAGGDEFATDHVVRLRQIHQVASDKAMLRDYNYEDPRLAVEATEESPDDGDHVLEVYDYPARATDPGETKRLTAITLEQLQMGRQRVEGETGALTLMVGLSFSVEDHPYGPLNDEYVVTGLDVEGTTPRLGSQAKEPSIYRCRFFAIPKAHALRSPRLPRQSQIVGLQTAKTTGPAGEEIHVSAAGETTIRYHWDRLGPEDDGSSRFARTSQPYQGGGMLLPRMDWEVTTTHDEGDPDRPMVMARMYNGQKPPPYKLPDESTRMALQTATSPGGGSVNELRMTDTAGSEEMYFNASKDMTVDVKNNTTEWVGNNASKKVGSNQTKNVTDSSTQVVGANQTVAVDGNQSISVETLYQDEVTGDHSLDIGGNRDMKVGGDHKKDVGGSSTAKVGGMQVDLVVGSTTDETLANYSHTVSAALVDITVNDRSLTVGGNITETAGAAKIIGVLGGRGMEVGGPLTQQVAGAIINVADGDRAESAGATYTEVAAGAHVVKAKNIVVEADTVLSLVMGASTLTLLPALVALAGVSVKLDGDVSDLAVLVIDN